MTVKEMTAFKKPISILTLKCGEIKSLGFFEPNQYSDIGKLIDSDVRDYYEAENDYEGRYFEVWI